MHVSNTAAASAIIQRYICRGVGSRSTLVSHMLALLSIRALHDLLVNQIIQVLFRLCLVLIPQELHQWSPIILNNLLRITYLTPQRTQLIIPTHQLLLQLAGPSLLRRPLLLLAGEYCWEASAGQLLALVFDRVPLGTDGVGFGDWGGPCHTTTSITSLHISWITHL